MKDEDGNEWKFIHERLFSFWILTTSREIFLRFRFFFLFCVTKKGGVLTNEGGIGPDWSHDWNVDGKGIIDPCH